MSELVDLDVLRRVAAVSARINAGRQLTDTLQAVADGVVEALGFGVAAVNYVLPGGDLQVLAVAGHDDARRALDGVTTPAAVMAGLLARAEAWGALRFAAHDTDDRVLPTGWVPDLPVLDHPDAWHPLDLLLAPLHAADGDLVGMLSVDMPPLGRRPGPMLRELLEIFAVQAGVAIENARLGERLRGEQAELRREQARLRVSEAAFRFSFQGSAGGMAMISLAAPDPGRFLEVNDALRRILGRPAGEVIEDRWQDLVHPDDRDESERVLGMLAAGALPDLRAERRLLRADRSVVWVALTETVVETGEDGPPFVLLHVDDITERRRREEDLTREARHDPLTGLPNRRVLLERVREASERARGSGLPGVLLFCDLNGFKELNDRLGHDAGDLALGEVAARLVGEVRTRDTVARLGGDEFVVLAEDLGPDPAAQLVARLRAAVCRPLGSVAATVGISIGLAEVTGAVLGAEDLLRVADVAMYADKARRGGTPGTLRVRRPADGNIPAGGPR